MLGKPTVATVLPIFTARLETTGNGRKLPLHLQQCQVIRRIHLHHLGGEQSSLSDQPHLRPVPGHMFIGNQISILRDEESGAGRFRACLHNTRC